MHLCHDYPSASRPARWQTKVVDQKSHNIHMRDGMGDAEFVAMRQARDATLAVPTLILRRSRSTRAPVSCHRRTQTMCPTCAFRSTRSRSTAEVAAKRYTAISLLR